MRTLIIRLYEPDEKRKRATLTYAGVSKAEIAKMTEDWINGELFAKKMATVNIVKPIGDKDVV